MTQNMITFFFIYSLKKNRILQFDDLFNSQYYSDLLKELRKVYVEAIDEEDRIEFTI